MELTILRGIRERAKWSVDETWVLDERLSIQLSFELLKTVLALTATRADSAHFLQVHLLRGLVTGAIGPLSCLLLLIDIALDVDYTDSIIILLLLASGKNLSMFLGANLLKRLDSLSRALYNRISNGFFHQIDLALSNKLHVSVRKWDLQLLCVVLSQAAQCFGLVGARGGSALLHGGEDEEGVALRAEVEVLPERAHYQERCVSLHLQEVVLLLPYERDAFELSQRVSLYLRALDLRLLLGTTPSSLLGEHEIENELLSPQDDAFDHIKRQHAQAVQDVDAFFQEGHVRPPVHRLSLLNNLA
mmetsp:Transcript_43605/g.57770  ORF Transcript_43605/g.57770 Transcript_43605/m.57770 type:complete len:303 (-) Transcript_43605:758-1666(-)|eukprot:CAMPEP_0185569596 /NCGR_PEP_ID=MMETSP0434-20130131/2173_1 /TAXON_ID=626734 ORGANISM="Favella taraikaensis, Strain Fe Narragansett Bay" /NCGR_SAMPLE_ID=MMETSP0434 /ASSEMBLY_ACC=CAM_ASM_000379 /LENGTH=302 /DNA_ID=CAMNT_0028184431 /DNA_START=1560 /DNA_END=2468 /DNA_ORIENTATION=+